MKDLAVICYQKLTFSKLLTTAVTMQHPKQLLRRWLMENSLQWFPLRAYRGNQFLVFHSCRDLMKKQRRGLSEAIGCLLKVHQNRCPIPFPHCHPNCLRDLAKEICGSITLLRSD